MDDEQLPGETGADEPNESTVDWERRYKDTHSSWNTLNEQMRRFESDPNALIEFIQEKHPDLLADEDEEPDTFEEDDFEDPRDAEIAQLKQQLGQVTNWQQDVEAERGERRFNNDLKKAWGDEDIDPDVRTMIKSRTAELGNNPDALKKAVEEWRTLERKLKGEHIDQVTRSKKAPHVSAGGQAGTQVPTLDTHEDRRAFYRQRIAEIQSQQ